MKKKRLLNVPVAELASLTMATSLARINMARAHGQYTTCSRKKEIAELELNLPIYTYLFKELAKIDGLTALEDYEVKAARISSFMAAKFIEGTVFISDNKQDHNFSELYIFELAKYILLHLYKDKAIWAESFNLRDSEFNTDMYDIQVKKASTILDTSLRVLTMSYQLTYLINEILFNENTSRSFD